MMHSGRVGVRIAPLVILASLGCSASTEPMWDSHSELPDAHPADTGSLDPGVSVPDAPWSADCLVWETVVLPSFMGYSPNPCDCYAPPYCNCLGHPGLMTWACADNDEYCC
jgi:hypothetical protein